MNPDEQSTLPNQQGDLQTPTFSPQTEIPQINNPYVAKKGNLVLAVFSLLLIVLTILLAFLAYQNWSLEKQLNDLKKSKSAPSSTLAPDPTTGWKSYNDPNGLYTFKYPPNYSLGHYSTDNSPLLLNNKIEWGITQHPAGSCAGDCPVITNKSTTTINGYSTTIYNGWVGTIGGEIPQSYIKYEIQQPESSNFFAITLWELDRTSSAQKNYSPTRTPGAISDSDKQIFNQIINTFKFSGQNMPMKTCSNSDLKVSLSIPSNWVCNSTETPGAGWIKITSNLFEINMSALGRGAFCDPGSNDPTSPRYDPANACQTTDFYTTKGASVKLYKLNGQNKEIFGLLGNAPGVWISIKWQNMETTDLTSDQKNQIINTINSIIFSK